MKVVKLSSRDAFPTSSEEPVELSFSFSTIKSNNSSDTETTSLYLETPDLLNAA